MFFPKVLFLSVLISSLLISFSGFLVVHGYDTSLKEEIKEAAKNGNVDQVRNLLDKGASPFTFEALKAALENGHQEVVKVFKERGSVSDFAIVGASEYGHLEIVKILIECGIKPSSVDNHAIWLASENGHTEIVELLLRHGADPQGVSASGNGHTEVVKLLLENGADPQARDNSAIFYASKNGHTEVVKLLLEKGADPQARSNYPIFFASTNRHTEVVKLLLEKGADPQARDNYPIVSASEDGHKELVKLLLEKGADPQANDNYPIFYASKNGHTELVKLLLEKGADPQARDNYPIVSASEDGHKELVKLLLEKGADPQARDNYPIVSACRNGHTEVVKLLLEKGANASEDSAICGAAQNGHLQVVDLLLENGANPTAMDNYPIVHAAKNGHTEVVKLLLKFGANPRAKNNEAVKLATVKGHSEIMALLSDGIVERMLLNNFTQHDPMGVLNLSKVRLVPGIPTLSVSLNLIQDLGLEKELEFIKEMGMLDKLCSTAKNVKLEFVGLNYLKVNVTKISGSNDLCVLDLDISWPTDLSLLAERNLIIKGQFMLSNGFIGIRPVELETILYYPEYSLSHPSIGNTSAFFVGETLNLNLNVDKLKEMFYNIVDGNQFKLQTNNQTFNKSFNMTASQFGLKVTAKSLFELKEKFQPFISFSINGTEQRINVKQSFSTSFHQAEMFFELPKRTFGLNEGISVNWIKASPFMELLKRNISLQVSRMGSNSSVFLKHMLPQSGFVSFPAFASLLVNSTDPFGSYVVKLIDMDGIIAFGEEDKRYFDIVRPTVDRIGLNQSVSDNNVTVRVLWESPVCSSLANVTKLNGILKANLTVSMRNESIYSVDLESYCILAHQFELPIGNLSFNTNYELKVTLFDTIGGILLATGNGTIFIAREDIGSSQETNRQILPLIIGGVILGVTLIAGIIAALLIIRKRRLRKLASIGKMDSFSVQSNSIFSVMNANRRMYSY